jgi:hypothetical protein
MGEAAYRQRSRDLLVTAEEIITALEEAFPDARTLLVGRAAKGHFDADPAIHVRVLTEASTTEIAAALNRMGYRDADLAFTTLDTAHHGRLSQVQWSEDDPAVQIILTRCPNNAVFESRRDLVTSRPLAILSRDALRKELAFDTDHTR